MTTAANLRNPRKSAIQELRIISKDVQATVQGYCTAVPDSSPWRTLFVKENIKKTYIQIHIDKLQ